MCGNTFARICAKNAGGGVYLRDTTVNSRTNGVQTMKLICPFIGQKTVEVYLR